MVVAHGVGPCNETPETLGGFLSNFGSKKLLRRIILGRQVEVRLKKFDSLLIDHILFASGEVEEVTEEWSMKVLDSVVLVRISDPGMVCLANVDPERGHRVEGLLEQDVHSIEYDLHDVSGLSDSLDLSDIPSAKTLDGLLGTAQMGDNRIELLVGDIPLHLDFGALGITALNGHVNVRSLTFSLFFLLL